VSAGVYWQAVKGKRINGQSTFAADLRLPTEFGPEDVKWLEGYAAGTNSAAIREAVNELIEAIHQHDRIRVWAEY
jgi:hypothetical protein